MHGPSVVFLIWIFAEFFRIIALREGLRCRYAFGYALNKDSGRDSGRRYQSMSREKKSLNYSYQESVDPSLVCAACKAVSGRLQRVWHCLQRLIFASSL